MKFDVRNMRISIVGAGRTGIATAEVVKAEGGIPFVSDSDPSKKDRISSRLDELGIESEFGGHTENIYRCDLMITSPGVHPDSDVLLTAKEKGIPVWPEIELAYRICEGKIIGITGSNGKTTTAALTGEILKDAGLPTFTCGNIGHPFIAIAEEVSRDGYAVVELSSFQLELIDEFCPDIAVFLNLTPDHLDRHGDIESYIAAKMRIFENQKTSDLSIVNFDDSTLRKRCDSVKSKTKWFSVITRVEESVWAEPDGDFFIDDKAIMKSSRLGIKGVHNLSNACAASAVAFNIGINRDKIVGSLTSFKGVEHRLEFVRLIGGVSFVNDSKGTNVDSVFWALKTVSTPIILIAGGKDKGGDFSVLSDLISGKVKLVIVIGEAASKIKATWSGRTSCKSANDMVEAVNMAFEESAAGDTVLLSPGCASFDMFDDFEHRGRVFKDAVYALEASEVAQ